MVFNVSSAVNTQRSPVIDPFSYFIFHASLVISLAILGDPESPDLSRWQEELSTVRHIFGNVFVGNQLAARCANILDIILPNSIATPDDWTNFQLDPWLMDFSTWPAEAADDFCGVLGWPDVGNVPE